MTGRDSCAEMLEQVRRMLAELGLANMPALRLMDARALEFAEHSFDHISALHFMSVVPEPQRVMFEMARVMRPVL